MKDYGETIRQADLILKEHPQFIPGLLYRGLSQQALGRPEKLRTTFRRPRPGRYYPLDRRFALNMLVDLALQQKNYAMALKRLEDLGKLEEDFNLSYRRGLAWKGRANWRRPNTAYRRALARAGRAGAAAGLPGPGGVGLQAPGLATASQAFQAAQNLDPDNPEVLRTLARGGL